LFDSPSADIIILLLILAITLALITDEKDKRIFLLVKSTPNGHIHTIVSKLSAIAVCIAGVSVLVFAESLIFTEITYGLGDVTRSVQSVPFLMGSTLRISVAEFIILHFFAKFAGLFCIGMIVVLIAIHMKHSIVLMAVTVLVAIANTLLGAIPVVSGWNILRFLNFFTLIRPHRVYGNYFNLNIFGNPVRLTPVFIVFEAVVFAVLLTAVCLSFVKKRGLDGNLALFKFKSLQVLPSKVHANWRYFEFKKLAFVNKSLLILTVFAVIQAHTVYTQEEPRFGFGYYYIMDTLNLIEGPLTDEKESFIISEHERYTHAKSELDRLNELMLSGSDADFTAIQTEMQFHQEVMQAMQGFPIVYERYEYVRENPPAEFLYDAGYVRLFGMKDADSGLNAGMRLLLVLILCLCGLFAMEYKTGMYKVLNATSYGSADTVKIKLLLSLSLTFIVFALTSLPELVYIGRFFGFNGLSKPLASVASTEIGAFPAFIGAIPIWSYIAFMLLMRFAVFAGITLIVSALSMKVKSDSYTALFAAGVLLLPLFLHLFGLELLNPVSLLGLITFNGIIVSPSVLEAVQAAVFASISILCGLFVTKKFGKV
jgi:hypothetical protein